MIFVMKSVPVAKLRRARKDPRAFIGHPPIWEPPSDGSATLGKDWAALNYLLTGSADLVKVRSTPVGPVILGGAPLGEEGPYGPPRLLDPEQTWDVARALVDLSFDQLWKKRFNRKRWKARKVYGAHYRLASKAAVEELRQELARGFNALVSYYAFAAVRGDAMLLLIT
jgi:hypothetical protein